MSARTFTKYISSYNSIINAQNVSAKPLKIAVLRSFSCEILEQLLTVDAFDYGYACEFHFGGFGRYAQEILDIGSPLYGFEPNIILLAVNIEDISRRVFDSRKIPSLADFDILKNDLDVYLNLISTLQKRFGRTVIVLNFVTPFFAGNTYYDMSSPCSFLNLTRFANTMLVDSMQNLESVFIYDLENLVNSVGKDNAFDLRQWYLSKNPYKTTLLIELSKSLSKMVDSIHTVRKKCIVVDLDNTLWRGVIGEDGLLGIEISDDFKDFQSQLLYWKNSGILLALNSKNNFDDAMEVFEKHSDMMMSFDDFACVQINWNDKASNMAHIAYELNIGLDSMIFIDDSEFECEFVRKECPQVEVIHFDGNSANYARIVREISSLNFLYLSDEDVNRTGMYKASTKRNALLADSESLTAYLESLSTELCIEEMNEATTRRAAQLTQKTNQFNLTSRRYIEDDLLRMQSEGYLILLAGVKDKFGDSGISGLVIVDTSFGSSTPDGFEKTWRLDNFLLSCRVMGRHIEKAVWAYVVRQAEISDVKTIIGEFIKTAKNKPVEGLLESFGFSESSGVWGFDVTKGYFKPKYISVKNYK